MKQDNNKIIEALKEWVEPIEGWFWDKVKSNAVKGELRGFNEEEELSFLRSSDDTEEWFNNFSLTNPNEKRFISTVEDAVAWSLANPNAVVRVFTHDLHYASKLSSKYFEDTEVLAFDGMSPVWTPLTEIECV